MGEAWLAVQQAVQEIELLKGAMATLQWDQQTYLPSGAGGVRGQQLAALSKVVHQRSTTPRFGDLLHEAEQQVADPLQRVAVQKLLVDYERDTKLPDDLVSRLAQAESDGFSAWIEAKKTNDYASYRPHLQTLLELSKEKAAAIDTDGHPLQVLMDEFDPGVQISELKSTFARLQTGLTELIDATRGAEPRRVGGSWPIDAQQMVHQRVTNAMGYDLNHGRVDLAEHPFTVSLGHGDTRITTHLYPEQLLSGLGGTIHETGHALYEQGLPVDLAGTGLDQPASYGLHESQSRFWENAIGHSLEFFQWLQPSLDTHFPGHTATPEQLYRAANRIEPQLIRVTADEVTYNLHIIVRVELELELFEGNLTTHDLPAAWNERYQRYLGVTPPSDAVGVMQDVHWATGAFAYFQSYTLGNLYAASLYHAIRQAMPDLDAKVRAGDFAPILAWLREHVHRHGRRDTGEARIRQVVGDRDRVEDLLSYLWGRHGTLYGLERP